MREAFPIVWLLGLTMDLSFCRESWQWLPTGLSGPYKSGRLLQTANQVAPGGEYSGRHVTQAAIFSHPARRHLPL